MLCKLFLGICFQQEDRLGLQKTFDLTQRQLDYEDIYRALNNYDRSLHNHVDAA